MKLQDFKRARYIPIYFIPVFLYSRSSILLVTKILVEMLFLSNLQIVLSMLFIIWRK